MKTKPISPDEARALTDLRCAARKLSRLMQKHQDDRRIDSPLYALIADLDWMADPKGPVTKAFNEINERVAKDGKRV